MAKTKAQLVKQAAELGIEVEAKAKVAEIQALINERKVESEASATPSEETTAKETPLEPEVAKAGKRSAKALTETKAKQLKEDRKRIGETEAKARPVAKPARSRAERRGKLYQKSLAKIDQSQSYSLDEAINLAKSTSHVKFDATVELHINLAVDPKHSDQNVRDNLILPYGTGKTVKVAVLSDDETVAAAAGADIFKAEEIFTNLDKGVINFDSLIASPSQMPKLGKYARTLGPKGLMPNPKSGTVSNDIGRAVNEAKGGRVEYRVDSTGIVHLGVGKVSFDQAKLKQNIEAIFTSLKANKPSSLKGAYVKAIHLSTTMGPSITVNLSALA